MKTTTDLVATTKNLWHSFHNAILLAILFSLIGFGAGLKVAKDIYHTKLSEVVQTGAMLHDQKVYTINPKL